MNELEISIASLYKTESAKILAVLTRIFGSHNLEMAEDVLQDAFGKALTQWEKDKLPDNPAAWIVRTAKNQAIDRIRANKTKLKFADDLALHLQSEWSLAYTVDQEFHETNIKDDQLRMIFMCCHESISPENRIPIILKSLCGFSVPAISRALLVPEASINKRLFRTRKKLKNIDFRFPAPDKLLQAMDSVHTVLYLLFNEGFHSSSNTRAINLEFCQEAIGLVNLLIDEPSVVNQGTLSLMSLMHFHIARVDSRVDQSGHTIPLNLQDRSLWNAANIYTAERFLTMAESAHTDTTGRFFIEAKIASEHCHAMRFEQTNWPEIESLYEKLVTITQSPMASLNHAVAIGYTGKLQQAITLVESLMEHKLFRKSHLPSATLAHLNAMAGNKKRAFALADIAISLGGTQHEHRLMMQQLTYLTDNKH